MDTLPVPGFPRYVISRFGQITDTARRARHGKLVATCTSKRDGYVRCSLVDPAGERRTVFVHRLVAQAFIPNPLGLPEVDHANGDKSDNRASQLVWTSHAGNLVKARQRLGNWNVKRNPSTIRGCRAYTYDEKQQKQIAHTFASIADAAEHFHRQYATFAPHISRAIKMEWKAYGFLWELVDNLV